VTIDIRGSALAAAIENGLSQLPAPSGRFPQVSGSRSRPIRAAPPASASPRSRSATRRSMRARPIRSRPTISCARRRRLRQLRAAEPVLPPADAPLVAYEVLDYIASIGTIRTGVDGRIVLK
jgi:5'-nucleotidase